MTRKDRFQSRFVHRHLLPLLCRFGYQTPVLDIGCGRGGILLAMAEDGNGAYYGIDTNGESIEIAREKRNKMALPVEASVSFLHMSDSDTLPDARTTLLCDVLEHTGLSVLFNAVNALSPGGLLYVSFPPWQGPYGGHQQTCAWWLRFPWLHLIPSESIYRAMLRTARNLEDVEGLVCLGIKWIELAASILNQNQVSLELLHRRRYILRPELARYGIPTIPAPWWWPAWLTTGVEFVYRKGGV